MPIKAEVQSLDEVPEPLRVAYRQVDREGSTAFVVDLDVETLPEELAGPLKRARDHERDRVRALRAEFEAFRVGNGLDEVEKRHAARESELKAEMERRDKAVHQTVVKRTAREMASRISTAPDLLVREIEARLTVKEQDGEYVPQVLKPDGFPSGATLAELEQEIRRDPRFSTVIIGPRASGAGASNAYRPMPPARDWSKFNPRGASLEDIAKFARWRAEHGSRRLR